MRLAILVWGFVFAMSAMAVSKGERGRAVRDTSLMSVTTKLAHIVRGTEFDVLEIDPKSQQWIRTTIEVDGKEISGWVLRRDVATVAKQCAKNYSYHCTEYWEQSCTQKCDPPVCNSTTSYECNYEYGYNPQTGQYEYFNNCQWVTKENCAPPVCTQECIPYLSEYCSCQPR